METTPLFAVYSRNALDGMVYRAAGSHLTVWADPTLLLERVVQCDD